MWNRITFVRVSINWQQWQIIHDRSDTLSNASGWKHVTSNRVTRVPVKTRGYRRTKKEKIHFQDLCPSWMRQRGLCSGQRWIAKYGRIRGDEGSERMAETILSFDRVKNSLHERFGAKVFLKLGNLRGVKLRDPTVSALHPIEIIPSDL